MQQLAYCLHSAPFCRSSTAPRGVIWLTVYKIFEKWNIPTVLCVPVLCYRPSVRICFPFRHPHFFWLRLAIGGYPCTYIHEDICTYMYDTYMATASASQPVAPVATTATFRNACECSRHERWRVEYGNKNRPCKQTLVVL